MYIMEANLSNRQFAFRRNKSTIDPLILLDSHVRYYKPTGHTTAIFFDLQKTYDTTWKHNQPILPYWRKYNVRPQLPPR